MADQEDSMNEEQWLYGDSTTDNLPTLEIKKEVETKQEEPPAEPITESAIPETNNLNSEYFQINPAEGTEPGEVKDDEPPTAASQENDNEKTNANDGGEEEEDEDDDDDSEDDVRVTIGDIKTAPQYSNLNIKRGAQLSSGIEKLNKQQTGKFSIEEFESIGTINGVPAHEFSIDALEDKPWRKPGADITDYFNYGFNEETWRAYCERQKQMRVHESGVGLGGLGVSRVNPSLTVVNENSKYASTGSTLLIGGPAQGRGKAGPPSSVRRAGVIDVIGTRRPVDSPPKEVPIQVMSSERREYNRKSFDMSVPPPGFDPPPPLSIVPSYPSHGGYNQDFYNPEMDPYYQSYDNSQDMQWGGQMMNQVWSSRHRDKKCHGSHSLDHPKRSKYLHNNSMNKDMELPGGVTIKQEPVEKSSKDRERDRESRHKDRHRHRSRSRSGDRSERRRKHKSRSRSPGHRSHKKKKSKKSDRSKEGSD
ncbi:pre-mRNA 3'-end-processing factor FIP1 isoform X1 [Halyomorpha halys]|uniref:pre-mRNA 3'-end-processing factor FIP1 isoform X1 n=1 Tax=Halyomorpha halys TaxID=286706 RepID=UPI0006D4FE05|nr:pre-mRNA 3'-end-processing factor FIP1 isoform X1 [Halyomorpha halys]